MLFKRLNLARNLRRMLSSFIDNRVCIRCHSCGIKSGTCFHVILINNFVILVYNYIGRQPYKALRVVTYVMLGLAGRLKVCFTLSVNTNIEQVSLQEIKHKIIQKNGFLLVQSPRPLITVKYRYISSH